MGSFLEQEALRLRCLPQSQHLAGEPGGVIVPAVRGLDDQHREPSDG